MKPPLYLLVALVAFLAGTLGSDIVARTFIAGETLEEAVAEHLRWWSVGATLFLLVPFLGVGLIGAALDKWASTRSAVLTFGAGTLSLLYFYFAGYQDAQRFLLEEKWTASALSVGLLPFTIGMPVLLLVTLTAGLALGIERRKPS